MANRFRDIETPAFEEEPELLASAKQQAEAPPATGESEQDEPAKKAKKSVAWSRQLLGGEILTSRRVVSQLPLVMLIIICAILMIGNRYALENLRKEVIATHKQIDQLSLQQIQMKSEYQQSVKISNIAGTLDTMGVHMITEPPMVLDDKR